MHGQDVLEGQEEIHGGKGRLLHLACVFRSPDEHHPLVEVDQDEDLRVRPVDLRQGAEAGAVDHDEFGRVGGQLFRRGLDEHVADEEAVPGILGDDAHRHPVVRIGPAPAILHEDVLALQVRGHAPVQLLEALGSDGAVHRTPPDLVAAARLGHDEPVIGRAAGELARAYDERAEVRHDAFVALECLLVQRRRRQIPVCRLEVRESLAVQADAAVGDGAKLLHGSFLR
jgi:hypothetical protein